MISAVAMCLLKYLSPALVGLTRKKKKKKEGAKTFARAQRNSLFEGPER